LNIFNKLGHSNRDTVALMGAHTIGGVNVCTGFGSLTKGLLCKNITGNELDKGSFFD